MGFCNECHHPCHCGEEKDLHADEYGVCSCEGCECKDSKIVKKRKQFITFLHELLKTKLKRLEMMKSFVRFYHLCLIFIYYDVCLTLSAMALCHRIAAWGGGGPQDPQLVDGRRHV